MAEIAIRVVPGAGFDAEASALDADLNPAEAAIPHRVRAAVAQQVVRRHIPLHPREGVAKIVGVGEGPTAGVGRERRQRVLRPGELIVLVLNASAGEHRLAASARLTGVTAWNDRLQPTRVDG